MLAALGVNLPINMTDVQGAADRITQIQGEAGEQTLALMQQLLTNPFDVGALEAIRQRINNLTDLQDQIAGAGEMFQEYALDYFGPGGPGGPKQAAKEGGTVGPLQDIFKEFSELIRPPVPKVARLPTAEEFMADFDNAFATKLEGIGGLNPEMARFARTEMAPMLLSKYTARLGDIAKTGQSPFYLTEVSREQRGIGPGSPAGQALEAALGPGVQTPTRISAGGPTRIETVPGGTVGSDEGLLALREGQQSEMLQRKLSQVQQIEAAQRQIEDIGQGIPREFIALPKIMPTQVLDELLTEQSIKVAFEGSRRGAGQFAGAGTGTTVARRV